MRRLICLLVICVALSGCGAFRKVFKLKESHQVEITQQRKTDSVGVTVDRSITTTVERIDTTITTPARTVTQEVPLNMDSLINGMTAIKNDLIDVSLHLNPVTGMLSAVATIKAQLVPVQMSRAITRQNDITNQTHKQEAVLNKVEAQEKRSTVDKEPMKFPNWIIIIAILLISGVGAFFWITRKR